MCLLVLIRSLPPLQSQLVAAAIPDPFGGGKNVFLVIGLASLALWAFSYFRGN